MKILNSRVPKLFAMAAAASLALTACGSAGAGGDASGSDPKSQNYDIAVVLKTLSSPYWLQVKSGVEAGAEGTGANVSLAGAKRETNIQEQINKVRAAITRQPDAIVAAPTAPKQLEPILQEAVNANIPVLLVDTNIAGWENAKTFIGTDNFAAGKQAGKFILSQAKSGKMALLGGVPGNSSTDQRIKGVKAAVEDSEIDIVAELAANSDRADAQSVMSDILTANPDVSIVFAANDDMALGAIEAIKAAGLDPADLTIVGVDGTGDAANSIIKGELTASIAQNSFKMGKTAVETAVKLLNGKDIKERIDTGTTLVTSKNAEEYLKTLESRGS